MYFFKKTEENNTHSHKQKNQRITNGGLVFVISVFLYVEIMNIKFVK